MNINYLKLLNLGILNFKSSISSLRYYKYFNINFICFVKFFLFQSCSRNQQIYLLDPKTQVNQIAWVGNGGGIFKRHILNSHIIDLLVVKFCLSYF